MMQINRVEKEVANATRSGGANAPSFPEKAEEELVLPSPLPEKGPFFSVKREKHGAGTNNKRKMKE